MPEDLSTWVALVCAGYLLTGVALVASDLQRSAFERPGYARRTGPHLALVIPCLPLASMLFFSVGGPRRFLKIPLFLVLSMVIVTVAFLGYGFVFTSSAAKICGAFAIPASLGIPLLFRQAS